MLGAFCLVFFCYKILLLRKRPIFLMSNFLWNLISKTPTPLTQIRKSLSPSKISALKVQSQVFFSSEQLK